MKLVLGGGEGRKRAQIEGEVSNYYPLSNKHHSPKKGFAQFERSNLSPFFLNRRSPEVLMLGKFYSFFVYIKRLTLKQYAMLNHLSDVEKQVD